MVFKSNGKFLLTGEYLVLKGATALALPLKKGQSLDVETLDSNEGLIHWDAFYKSTANGQQPMVNSQQSMVNSQWSMVNVQWSTVNVQ